MEILKFWKEHDGFKKGIEQREGGPPTADGMPHIGHIITRVVKDLVPRYRATKDRKERL